jgi:hypothetical protein
MNNRKNMNNSSFECDQKAMVIAEYSSEIYANVHFIHLPWKPYVYRSVVNVRYVVHVYLQILFITFFSQISI